LQVKQISRRTLPAQSASILDPALHPVLSRLYLSRGVSCASELQRQASALLPFTQLKDIDRASALLVEALTSQQRIVIVGDFDADGVRPALLC